MKTKTTRLPRATVESFAEQYNLTMEVVERGIKDGDMRFYAHFERAEVMRGGFLVNAFGNGRTEDEAIANYAKEISGECIAIDAYTNARREIRVPILV